eukprot:g48347.t1
MSRKGGVGERPGESEGRVEIGSKIDELFQFQTREGSSTDDIIGLLEKEFRQVHIYEGDGFPDIGEAIQNEPIAVWLLGSQDKQLSVDQFILQDGCTYRTQEAHIKIQAACEVLGDETLAQRAFGVNHAASIVARERNGWNPTPASHLDDIQKACAEQDHGGLWNSTDDHVKDVISIDVKACYPASFQGQGEARPYFERFGHPTHPMTQVAINKPLPREDDPTGFAEVTEWEFRPGVHPVIPAWFEKHFEEQGCVPTPLLAYLIERGLLTHLKVREALISFDRQKEAWLPGDRDQGCSIIGNSQPQYTHLRVNMLAYAHINLIAMLQRFHPHEAVRVATDSIYVQKTALHKLQGIKAYVAPRTCGCKEECQNTTAKEKTFPLTHHQLSYLNGGGGSGKTRAIELFRVRDPLVFTPMHRLAKEMRARGVKAQIYHSFFRWSGQNEWMPDRMGQKFIPHVIIWDEVCTVPWPILETFLAWLEQRGVQVICCGDQGQPPSIGGEMPHDWLHEHFDYYEEVEVNHRAKEDALKALKRAIRLQTNKVHCQKVRDRTQELLFQSHKQRYPDTPVPLLYHPKDSRKQNIMVTIPGTENREELVLNDIVEVAIEVAEQATASPHSDWCLGCALTVHSSQGLSIHDLQKVWIIDDYLQWANLAYLAVSRVKYMRQLERN